MYCIYKKINEREVKESEENEGKLNN